MEPERPKHCNTKHYWCRRSEGNAVRKVGQYICTCLCTEREPFLPSDSLWRAPTVYFRWAIKGILLLHFRILSRIFSDHEHIYKLYPRSSTRRENKHLWRIGGIHCGERARWISWRWRWYIQRQFMILINFIYVSVLGSCLCYVLEFFNEPVAICEPKEVLWWSCWTEDMVKRTAWVCLVAVQNFCLMLIIISLHKYFYIIKRTEKFVSIEFWNFHFRSYE